MRHLRQYLVLALIGLHAPAGMAESTQINEAKQITQRFAGSLKPQLMQAMKAGGPQQAVEVCAEKAPSIAKQLSAETGWKVKRVSLKTRNPNAAPDDWEKAVLEKFEQRLLNGEKPKDMAYSETINGEFRFMKAQGVAPLCLNCHGQNIAPEVQAAINTHYPHDQATGYQQGQIRGAISLRKAQ